MCILSEAWSLILKNVLRQMFEIGLLPLSDHLYDFNSMLYPTIFNFNVAPLFRSVQ